MLHGNLGSLGSKESIVFLRYFLIWKDFILKFKPTYLSSSEEHFFSLPLQLSPNSVFHLGPLQCGLQKPPPEVQVLVFQGVGEDEEGKGDQIHGDRRLDFRRWAHNRVYRCHRDVHLKLMLSPK